MSVRNVKNKPIIYGLTGGIASGKTTAANFFISKNIPVFDSDKYVGILWENDITLKKTIKKRYNINMDDIDGKKKLADLLFKSKKIRKELNQLIHPIVFNGIDEFIKQNTNEKFLIIDMPLLIETNYYKNVDYVILIYVDYNTQVERLMSRNKITEKEAITKIKAQIKLEDKLKKSDYIIDNNLSIENTYNELEKLLKVMSNE